MRLGPFDQQSRLDQRRANAGNLGGLDLHQRRPHVRLRNAAEQHQRLLHAVVHVDGRGRVEDLGQRVNAVVDAPGLGQIVALRRRRTAALAESGRTLPEPESRPPQPSTSEENSQALCVDSTVTGFGKPLQHAHILLILDGIVAPILDGAHRRHGLRQLDDHLGRVALVDGQRIVEGDQAARRRPDRRSA